MLDNRQYRTVTPQVRGKKGTLHSPSFSVRGEFWDLGWRDGTQAGKGVSPNWGGKVGSGWNLYHHTQEEGVMQKVVAQKSVSFKIVKRKKKRNNSNNRKNNPQGLREIACYGDKTFREMPNTVLNDVGVWTKQTGEILVTLVIQLRSQKNHSLGLKITP